jgi:hypothetical protein
VGTAVVPKPPLFLWTRSIAQYPRAFDAARRYGRVASTTVGGYPRAGDQTPVDPDGDPKLVDVVRNLYQKAWSGDRNGLIRLRGSHYSRRAISGSGGVIGWMRMLTWYSTACAVAGCTTVQIHNADVEQTGHLGIVVIKVQPGSTRSSVIVTNGIGLTLGLNSATLGYLAETVFLAPDAGACRAVIVIKDPVELQQLLTALETKPQLSQLCVASTGGTVP